MTLLTNNQENKMDKVNSIINAVGHETYLACAPTGSKVICEPPVMDTDEDWIVWVKEEGFSHSSLLNAGFVPDGENYHDGHFTSYRKGELNLILIEDKQVYSAYCRATDTAKSLNIRDKADRITLFDLYRKYSGETK